jgi:TPR repeat protein
VSLSVLAAEQGDAKVQSNLGVMYAYGKSVLQDNVMAHMWYNIASANGHDKAGEWRDERADLMSSADISKAQAMARECMSSSYKKCGY